MIIFKRLVLIFLIFFIFTNAQAESKKFNMVFVPASEKGDEKDYTNLISIVEKLTGFEINIKDITINRFIVISKYPEALNENLGIKKFAIWDLEEKVSVKESTIRVILKRFQKAFKFRERLTVPKL